MKFPLFLALLLMPALLLAGPFDPRATFGQAPGRDLDAALKRAKTEKKNVLLFFWNSKEKDSPGLDMIYFAELEETKKLLKQHFILVLLDRDHVDVKPYIPSRNIEKAQWVLIHPDGTAVKSAQVYGNPNEGLKVVKELAAIP